MLIWCGLVVAFWLGVIAHESDMEWPFELAAVVTICTILFLIIRGLLL